MLQRAMIAMALALQPRLLIADEPSTALDVTVQAQILRLLRRLQAEFGMALILITHDLGVIAGIADDVMVMYAGQAMEYAPRRALFRQPSHPYTSGLLASLPRVEETGGRLAAIAGQPPSLIDPPSGCPFHPRCPQVFDRCRLEQPPFIAVPLVPGHEASCWLLDPATEGSRNLP
jgi:oligopeptide/dipeptide ABC transporter ATP-binding protein